ncbi:MAG: hypothetical protein R2731_01950 [Nocardioides sp.]
MADKGFGSNLWQNVQAIRIKPDGSLTGPVRATAKDGIVGGVDAVAKADAAHAAAAAGEAPPARRGLLGRVLGRLLGR